MAHIRARIKEWIATESTAMKGVVIVLAIIAVFLANRLSYVAESGNDAVVIALGIPTIILALGGLYVGALAVIALYRDVRGTDQRGDTAND